MYTSGKTQNLLIVRREFLILDIFSLGSMVKRGIVKPLF